MTAAGRGPALDVLIVGGGHAGLLTAHALLACGLTVALVDPEAPEDVLARPFDGRALALMYGAKRIIAGIGVWPWLRPVAEPVERVLVEDVTTGQQVTYEAREIGAHAFAYGIENRELRRQLLRALIEDGRAEILAPARLHDLARGTGAIEARLEDGRVLETALVIGADGRRSRVRALAGIEASEIAYGQTALTFAIAHSRPHERRVHERLFPSGPLALLPLRGRMSSVTWIEGRRSAERLLALPPAELLSELRPRIGDGLGALEIMGTPAGYPLGCLHARRYVAQRIALVGDAAHGVHPIHAQGFNMGVADIGALAEAMVEARRAGLDIGSGEALLPYERRRRLDNTLLVNLTDGLNRLFSNDVLPLALARGLGLAALEHIAPLKRLAMRRGMGLTSEPPRLARSAR